MDHQEPQPLDQAAEVVADRSKHGVDGIAIDNLSEETRKGMTEKAAQGFWPSNAPLGYRNVAREDGRKIIVPDEMTAPIIRKMFESYAWGDMSTQEVTREAQAAGLVFRKSRGRVPKIQSRRYCETVSIPDASIGMVRPIRATTRPLRPQSYGSGGNPPSLRLFLKIGSPSYHIIEPCAWLRALISSTCWSTFESCARWPDRIGMQCLVIS